MDHNPKCKHPKCKFGMPGPLGGREVQVHEGTAHVESTERLEVFLYHLMEEYLPVGTVEKLVYQSGPKPDGFSNGHLAHYAKFLAKQLK